MDLIDRSHEFQQGKLQSPAPGKNSPRYWYMLGAIQLEISLAEKNLVDTELNMSRRVPLKQRKPVVPRAALDKGYQHVKEGDSSFLHRAGQEYCVQFWAPRNKRGVDILEIVQ